MRGTVAKRIREEATFLGKDGNDIDHDYVKLLKHDTKNTGQNPKLEKNPRWLRSPLRKAKKPTSGDGLHFQKSHPLRLIAGIYADLTEQGQRVALHLAKNVSGLTNREIRAKIKDIKEKHVKPEPESNKS